MFSKNPPIKKWGSKSNFFTDYFIWLYHNFSLPCPCYILCTLFLSSIWILEAVSAPKHQAWFLLPDQISFLITAASFFVLFSFFRTDFFCKNSAASSQQHFFLPIRFLFQVRFPFANWRLSFAVWFLFPRQISYRKTPPPASDLLSFPRSDSTPQIRGSLLQYDFFFPVRFLTAKLLLRIPWPFLFPDQVSFPQSVAVLPSGQSSPLRLTCCRKRHRQADRRRHSPFMFSRQTKSPSHFLHKWRKAEAASFHW